jgi:multiple sugar transport system substrate-binding protein
MTTLGVPGGHALSRRGFLGLTGAAALPLLLAGCGAAGGKGSSSLIKFWDMPWGNGDYNGLAKKTAGGYKPSGGLPGVNYQAVQWNNFFQTYSSAIASNTGPALGTAGGPQALAFAEQGGIAYADDLVASFKKSGFYDDFLPGTVEAFKTDKGYVSVPWVLDMRVLWYRKSLLDKAGVEVPTTWDEWLTVGKALTKIGVYGFGSGAGAGNNYGPHSVLSMMINNGGGIFDKDGNPDCVTDRNIETVEYLNEFYQQGIIDPSSVSYTQDNLDKQWKAGTVGLGIYGSSLDSQQDGVGDLLVASPIAGPHGDKGFLYYANNFMMFKNTPSQEGTEAFLTYYMQHMKVFWQQKVISSLPVLKSIVDTPEFQSDKQSAKIIEEWQPVNKLYSTLGPRITAGIASLDGGEAVTTFTQKILSGQASDAKGTLTALQSAVESALA